MTDNSHYFYMMQAQHQVICAEIVTAQTRPSVLYRPALEFFKKSGTECFGWVANYGSIIAHGDTPEEAMLEFDYLFKCQKKENP